MQTKNETPNRVAPQSGASSFLVTAAKHPPGYLLSFESRLSSHLLMQWLSTPAITAIKKERMTSIQTPPPVAGYRTDRLCGQSICYAAFRAAARLCRVLSEHC